jgi:flagellar hook assembly protein FlgD
LERNEQTGELEFYFTNEEAKHVTFEILSENNEVLETLADKEYKAGGHIVRYDSTRLENGVYFYQLRTDNQKTAKKMIIQN